MLVFISTTTLHIVQHICVRFVEQLLYVVVVLLVIGLLKCDLMCSLRGLSMSDLLFITTSDDPLLTVRELRGQLCVESASLKVL